MDHLLSMEKEKKTNEKKVLKNVLLSFERIKILSNVL